MNTYEQFLMEKTATVKPLGFEVGELSPALYEWQRSVVRRALLAGRHAFFQDCGLGKSPQSLEFANQVARHTSGRVLMLAPLAVAHQFVREAEKFSLPCQYAQSQGDAQGPVVITNYERVESFNPDDFAGVVLDESSILKAFSGKVKRTLVDMFARTPFRLCLTATPAPNDVVELGNHAEFLGVMKSNEMLARWFINDSGEAGVYRLKRHAAYDFWRWVASWSVTLGRPSDLLDESGQPFSDEGYELPPLRIVEHVVKVEDAGPADGQLFRNVVASATTLHKELRRSLPERVEQAAAIIRAEPTETWLLWCSTNEEEDSLVQAIPEAVAVRGSMSADEKTTRLRDFAEGRSRILITKGGIAGFGMNFQHCARMVKLASNFSFEEFYQEVRRCWRFGQRRQVDVHVICASGEERIRAIVAEKQAAHEVQRVEMVRAQRDVQLDSVAERRAELGRAHIATRHGTSWTMHNADCVEVMSLMPDNCIDLNVHSPPFSSLYIYSASLRDMGNCRDDEEFFRNYDFLIPQMLRTLKAGRICAVHCKDLPDYRGSSGALGIRDFPGEIIRRFEAARLADGTRFKYASRITIWKDPVTEMHKTKSHGLLYKTVRTNASYSRMGLPDYMLVFRKVVPGDTCDVPVLHTTEDFPLEDWQQYASPVWMDIDHTDTLNVQVARVAEDEKHLAPLPLPVVRRCVRLWSNPGELVFSPFAGIGSEGVGALELGRRFEGTELKPSYFTWACRNLEKSTAQGDLFTPRASGS